MLCEMCHQREATVHLTQTFYEAVAGHEPGMQKQHFCRECADTYFACTPRMNPARGLISLSDSYRSKLYDLLEVEHPEAFDYSDTAACGRASELTRAFLRQHLKRDGIELNEDGFEMLWIDLNCSHHFYSRADEYKRKKG
jgi:hypothetical protein